MTLTKKSICNEFVVVANWLSFFDNIKDAGKCLSAEEESDAVVLILVHDYHDA